MRTHDTVPVPYPLALVITLAVEVPVYLVVFRFAGILAGWRGLGAAVGVNLATHPVAWRLLSSHPGWLVPVEAAVVAVEAALLFALVRREPALLALTALVANAGSLLAGLGLEVWVG
jgi:hypothetical protein